MAETGLTLTTADIPGRGGSMSPFTIVNGATGFIDFAHEVFAAREVVEARASTPAGLLIHAEIRLGDSLLLLADAQEGWQTRPGLFQVWVADVDAVLALATERGARVVTPPTPFYGSLTLARVEDPWGNLWWLFQPTPGQDDPKPVWEGGSDVVFRTIDEYMRGPS
jgi:uncharacterized glyoxalase superfamily protein PhnB